MTDEQLKVLWREIVPSNAIGGGHALNAMKRLRDLGLLRANDRKGRDEGAGPKDGTPEERGPEERGEAPKPTNIGQGEQPQQEPVATWDRAEDLSNDPGVHSALVAFSHDSTGDNGTGVVQAILEALYRSPQAPDNSGAWISVEERLPEAHVPVLCYTKHGSVLRDRYDGVLLSDGRPQFNGDREEWNFDVTHWMPLPASPTIGDRERL